MWHLDNTDATAKPAIVHAAVDLPTVLLGIIDFNGLEIRRAVEATDCHQLAVDDGQTNLPMQTTFHTLTAGLSLGWLTN